VHLGSLQRADWFIPCQLFFFPLSIAIILKNGTNFTKDSIHFGIVKVSTELFIYFFYPPIYSFLNYWPKFYQLYFFTPC
jgi:hypothetical protein